MYYRPTPEDGIKRDFKKTFGLALYSLCVLIPWFVLSFAPLKGSQYFPGPPYSDNALLVVLLISIIVPIFLRPPALLSIASLFGTLMVVIGFDYILRLQKFVHFNKYIMDFLIFGGVFPPLSIILVVPFSKMIWNGAIFLKELPPDERF